MGQRTMEIQGIQLTTVRTFLDPVDGGSDRSRNTRSTGDRPKYAELASESEQAKKLPPRGADYGPCRKKFQLVQANVALQEKSGPVQDIGLVSAKALSVASDESVATIFSLSSREFYSAVMCNSAVIEDIAKELDEELASIQQGFEALPVISTDILNAHFGYGTALFKHLITLLFERSPPPAHEIAALSAVEAQEVMDKTIKRVSIFLGKQVLDSLGFLTQALSIPDGFGNHNQQRFQESLEKAFVKAAKHHLMHDIYADRLRSVVSLESLQNSMLGAIDDVLYQQLRQKAVSLVTTQAKFDRRDRFIEKEKASFNFRRMSSDGVELTRRRQKAAAERKDWEEQKQKVPEYARNVPWGAPKPETSRERSNRRRFPEAAAQAWLSAKDSTPRPKTKPPPNATLGMWIEAKLQ